MSPKEMDRVEKAKEQTFCPGDAFCVEITQDATFVPVLYAGATILPFILHPIYPLPDQFYAIIKVDRLASDLRCLNMASKVFETLSRRRLTKNR